MQNKGNGKFYQNAHRVAVCIKDDHVCEAS